MKAGMKPWHLEGLFSVGEYEYLRSTVSGYFLVSKITPPAMASSFPSHTYIMYTCITFLFIDSFFFNMYVVPSKWYVVLCMNV